MKIISINIGNQQELEWNGRRIKTGIFKKPVNHPVKLMKLGVEKDFVADKKHHGGEDKACYLYSADHYPYWKEQFPDLEWQWGMFGENLTVKGLDEGSVRIGDTFRVGDAMVQVSQPRLPCNKLGIRMKSLSMVKQFLESPYPGVYLRIVNEGVVKTGDVFELQNTNKNALSVREVYCLFSSKRNDETLIKRALDDVFLAESIKADLRK